MTDTELVMVEQRGAVALVQLNRPAALNSLSPDMMAALIAALDRIDADPDTHVAVIAGHERAFVAGADIKSMQHRPLSDVLSSHTARFWFRLAAIQTPMIAAVSGPAFGGGCELALSCDLVVASETAVFSQAEITVGIMPGGGGTQRLARTIGKHRAMELVLTGRRVSAAQAYEWGFVNRVTAPDRWLDEALELAAAIAAGPPLAVRSAKQAVLAAEETGLGAGMVTERRLFELTYGSQDRVEGMTAFLERRPPHWTGQ